MTRSPPSASASGECTRCSGPRPARAWRSDRCANRSSGRWTSTSATSNSCPGDDLGRTTAPPGRPGRGHRRYQTSSCSARTAREVWPKQSVRRTVRVDRRLPCHRARPEPDRLAGARPISRRRRPGAAGSPRSPVHLRRRPAAHDRGADAPGARRRRPDSSVRAVYDYFRNVVHADVVAAWTARPTGPGSSARPAHPGAGERQRAGTYVDCHVWLFTPRASLSSSTSCSPCGCRHLSSRRWTRPRPIRSSFT